MTYRKRWARTWDDVKTCSEACRKRGVGPTGRALEEALLVLLRGRPASATLCPTEVARRVAGEEWRSVLESARAAGRRLATEGRVVFLRGGRRVDPSTARGPVRLGRGPAWT